MHWDHPRSPVSALLLTRLGEEHAVPASVTLRDTGLSLDQLQDPQVEVSARQELDCIANLLAALDHAPGLGLLAGTRYHLTSYGLWGFMLISSPTPRDTVDLALRYLDLTFAFCRVTTREQGEDIQVVLTADDVRTSVRRFVLEREAAAIRTLVREAFPDAFELRQVSFALPAPTTASRGLFGVEPGWDADETFLSFDASALDQPMPQADEHAQAVALAQCRDLLQRRQARAGLSGKVRDLLVARIADPPPADRAAGELGLSARTLQRRLATEGTSYRQLLDEVRAQLAEELLVTGGLTVGEVARRLGYVEVSSFSQAFRRWYGESPRRFLAR